MAVTITLHDLDLADLSMLATIFGDTWQEAQETLNEYFARSVPQALDFARDVVVNSGAIVDIGRWPWHLPLYYTDLRLVTWATADAGGDFEVTFSDGTSTITNVHVAGATTQTIQTMVVAGGANDFTLTAEQLTTGAGTLHLVLIETVDIAAGAIPA